MPVPKDWPCVEENTGSDTGELTPRVEEQAGNETDDAKSTVTSTNSSRNSTDSSDSVASCYPPLKRPRLDDLPKKVWLEGYDIAMLSEDDYYAYLDSLDEVDVSEPKTKVDGCSQSEPCAEIALAHYNQEKNVDYEFTRLRSMSPFRFPRGYKGTHLNFYARLRGSESEETELFYAELDHCENKVYNCGIVTSLEDDLEYMIHPLNVSCEGCADGSHGLGDWMEDDEMDEEIA